MKVLLSSIYTVLLCAVSFTSLQAAAIRGVTVTAVSSQFTNGADQRRGTNIVNGGGLFGEVHTTVPQGTMWLTSLTTTNAFTNAFITFDLGSLRTLNQMKVWNYNERSGATLLTQRGIQQAHISTAGENGIFTTNFPNTSFTRAPGTFDAFPQSINLGGISARYVRINVLTDFGGDNRVGLSEVQFIDNTVAPVLVSASRSYSADRVTVWFSEAMTPATATNPANYTIQSGATAASVLSAMMDFDGNRVVLHTSTLDTNLVYTLTVQNVRDAASIISVPTNSQVTIEPELVLWLKADVGVSTDGSGFVTQWNDQSGSGNHAIQSNAVARPLLVAGAANGHPVLRFDGITNALDVPHTPNLTIRGDLTVYAVVSVNDFANYNGIIAKTAGNQPAPFDFYFHQATGPGRVHLYRGNGSGNSLLTGTTIPSAGPGAYNIISAVISGTNATQYLNGAFNGTSSGFISGILDAGRPIRIGSRDDFFTRLKGDIAEIVLVRGVLSASERAGMDSYLGTKYGISVISLNITTQPADVQKVEGQTANFSVTVTASSPEISYQWQKNNVDILGATNTSYTTPVLSQSDNLNTYRVFVSIPGNSLFSDAATLTVIPDVELPTIISVVRRIWNLSEIQVIFSESMSPSTATNLANYSLDNGGTLLSAVMGASNQVTLTSTNLVNGTAYNLTVQSVTDLYNNTLATATLPLELYPAGLAIWLNGSVGLTTDGSGLVSQWNDMSGNNNHALQNFDAIYMPVVTNKFNNQPFLQFDGFDDYMYCLSSPSLAITGDISIYAVASLGDFANFNAIVSKTTGNQPASFDYYMVSGSGFPRLYRGNGAISAQVSGTNAPSVGQPHVVYVRMSGTSVNHFLDGRPNGSGTLNTSLGDNGDAFGIGTRSDLGTRMKGDFAEILVFSSALADADRIAIDNYLGSKYGILTGPLPENITIKAIRVNNNIVLSWPVPAGNFILESTSNLGSSWASVTNVITSTGGTNSVSINASAGRQFYRLRK